MQFSISFDSGSPNLANLTSNERQDILNTANAAGAIWAEYLAAVNVTLELVIKIDNSLFSGSTLAVGGPSLVSTNATFEGETVYEAVTAIELRTGQDRNGSGYDLNIGLTENSIRNSLYFKTDPNAGVPAGRIDALSVFLHEIGHGLGIIYVSDDTSFPGTSIYDTFVQNGTFTGANAVAAYGRIFGTTSGLPLEASSLGHLRENSNLRTDLMSTSTGAGVNVGISEIDLAILLDLGVPLKSSGGSNPLANGQPSDFNADGRADALWRNNDGNAVIWQFGANGILGSQVNMGTVNNNLWSFVSAGDYNGDGRGDILLRGAGGTWANWLMNGAAIATSNTLPGFDNSWQVRGSGDFDRDGRADILWQRFDGLTAISQMGSDGKIAASTTMGVVDPGRWALLAVADFNGDRKADVLLRNADGTFANWLMNGSAIGGSNTLGTLGTSWTLRAAADFNGDGMSDLLFQKYDGDLAMWFMGSTGNVVSRANIGNLSTGTWEIRSVADYSGDRKADVLLRNKADGHVWQWRMDGAAIAGSRDLGVRPASWSILPGINRVAPSDFGADLVSDVLWQNADGNVVIWELNTSGSIWSNTALGAVPVSWSMKNVADFNGDGRSDVLLRNTDGTVANWIMGGAGILTSNTLAVVDANWAVKGIGDFDRDGTADILWQKNDGTVVIWQMNGAGQIASGTNLGVVNPAVWTLETVAQLNGDGYADVLLRKGDGTVAEWFMDGARIAGSNTLGSMDGSWSVKGAGDFNADGVSDLVWQRNTGAVSLWQMNSSGGIGSTSNLGTLTNETVIGVGDYNGDGSADILRRTNAGSVSSWLNPSTSPTIVSMGSMSSTWTAATA